MRAVASSRANASPSSSHSRVWADRFPSRSPLKYRSGLYLKTMRENPLQTAAVRLLDLIIGNDLQTILLQQRRCNAVARAQLTVELPAVDLPASARWASRFQDRQARAHTPRSFGRLARAGQIVLGDVFTGLADNSRSAGQNIRAGAVHDLGRRPRDRETARNLRAHQHGPALGN